MSRQVIECGAIVCSAIALHSWVQPAASDAQPPECDPRPNAATQSCARSVPQPLPSAAPDRPALLAWSDRRTAPLPDSMERFYASVLEQAQSAAHRDQIRDALQQAAGIPKNSRHYAMAQQLQEDWAREIVRQATNECRQARVPQAIALLDTIPAASQWHARVAELRQRWQSQSALFERAQAASAAGDWQAVIDAVQRLEDAPMYHSTAVQALLQQAMTQLYQPDAALLEMATADLPTLPNDLSAVSVPAIDPDSLRPAGMPSEAGWGQHRSAATSEATSEAISEAISEATSEATLF